MKLSDVLSLSNFEKVNNYLEGYFSFKETSSTYKKEDIVKDWSFLNDSDSNASSIDVLTEGEKGLVERITNGFDAFIEKIVMENQIRSPKSIDSVLKKAYRDYYDSLRNVDSRNVYNASINQNILLSALDGSKQNLPTFDVIDLGTGILGRDFKDTILSLQKGNKISTEKSYLIGSFGQGGSTSLSFSKATLIISKFDNEYYFTIIRSFNLDGYKNHVYMYLTQNGEIPKLEADVNEHNDKHIDKLLSAKSGTMVRLIDLEIDRRLRASAITDPGALMDYLNVELFDTKIPLFITENRERFASYGEKNLARTVLGSKQKILRSKRYLKDYSGSMSLNINGIGFKVDYYIILPKNDSDWGNENICKTEYRKFNYHEKPIIFTVNGQYINGEHYTKIKNKGITFLNYRLLVHIDLDQLGSNKYTLFTTNRSSIKNTDLTIKLIDQIAYQLSVNPKIKEINDIIMEKSLDQSIEFENLKDLSDEVKKSYLDFLKPNKSKKFRPLGPRDIDSSDDDFGDVITDLIISNKKDLYYKDESVRIILKTVANKKANSTAHLAGFINDKEFKSWDIQFMNGRIQYTTNDLIPGDYSLFFSYFENGSNTETSFLNSNTYNFSISNEKLSEEKDSTYKDLNLEIMTVKDSELILDIVKVEENKKILVKYNDNHSDLTEHIYGRSSSEIKETKLKLTKPIILYGLVMDKHYERLDTEIKNASIVSFARSHLKYS